MSFGREVREKYFTLLDSRVTPINHGSYGLTPTPVFETFVESMKNDYKHPDKYMFETEPVEYLSAIHNVSQIVNCDYKNLAIIDNATSGINIIYRSMKWKAGDKVLVTSVVYDSCEHVLEFMRQLHGIEIIKLNVDIEASETDIVHSFEQIFRENLDDGNGIKLCMFDLVSSMPAFLFPYKQLVTLCRKYNVMSVIDGAHGIGLIPLDLQELNPDFFVSNLHKWYYVPRPCALLYVASKHHESIQPFPISHVFIGDEGANTLIKKFYFLATKNYAYFNCVKSAREFRDKLGGDVKIWNYCHSLKHQVTDYLVRKWGTKALSAHQPLQMVNIVMPDNLRLTSAEVDKVRHLAIMSHHYFQIGSYKSYCLLRLSFQVYNEFDDYIKAIDMLESLIVQIKASNQESRL